jgi:hypothetical protein
MAPSPLTAAQRLLLQSLQQWVPVARIDRLWIFPPHIGKRVETGLVVVSALADERAGDDMRELVTVGYSAEQLQDKLQMIPTVAHEGWASSDRLDRVIAGVLNRSGDAAAEPVEEHIEVSPSGWPGFLERIGVVVPPP